MSNKALLLDRDGVINIDYGYVYQPAKLEFVPGICEVCLQAQHLGYQIIAITNQSGIARGYFTVEDLQRFHAHLIQQFSQRHITITDIFYCPDLEGEDRKPNSGMFQKAQVKYHLDMEDSVSIGDNERDIIAAVKAGVGTNYLLSTTANSSQAQKIIRRLTEVLPLLK